MMLHNFDTFSLKIESFERGGGHKKSTLYAVDNVGNSGCPLVYIVIELFTAR